MTEPPTTTIATAIVHIGPAEASSMLRCNHRNRPVRAIYVQRLAEAMRRGEWRLNGEAIQVATDGTLLNGQHRLEAVVQSGETVPMLVVSGLPLRSQDTIDTGTRRRLADVLALRGETDTTNLASALTVLHRYRNGFRLDNAGHTAPTPQQALRLLEAEPGIRDAVRFARRVRRDAGLSPSIGALSYHVFSTISSSDTTEFFDRLCDPEGLDPTDPVYRLRAVLDRAREERSYAPTLHSLGAMTIKAWNAFREGQSMELLLFRPGGKSPEKFPVPR